MCGGSLARFQGHKSHPLSLVAGAVFFVSSRVPMAPETRGAGRAGPQRSRHDHQHRHGSTGLDPGLQNQTQSQGPGSGSATAASPSATRNPGATAGANAIRSISTGVAAPAQDSGAALTRQSLQQHLNLSTVQHNLQQQLAAARQSPQLQTELYRQQLPTGRPQLEGGDDRLPSASVLEQLMRPSPPSAASSQQ